MIHFGWDAGRKGPSGGAAPGRLAADPALMQLLPLMALRTEAAASGLIAHRSGGVDQARAFVAHAALLTEIARRTGEIETLGRAASAVLRARDLAKGDRRALAAALLQNARILRLGAALFGDEAAAQVAGERLDEALGLSLDPLSQARLQALRGALLAQAALAAPEPVACGRAVAALSDAAKALRTLAEAGKADASEAQEVVCDRAELLIAAGQGAKDRATLDLAMTTLDALLPDLDPAYRPLTWARAEILRGQAFAALGDLLGEAAALAEASAVLTAVTQEIPAGHSPLDTARAGHALGLVLQSLGEACDEGALFDRAVAAFAPALEALDSATLLPLRSVVAHDAAACLARRAERTGDLPALMRAETAFRDALHTRNAGQDPLAWAVTQVALARIYEAQADLRGDAGERAAAAFALASALEVFAERGLRALSEVALTALERVKAPT